MRPRKISLYLWQKLGLHDQWQALVAWWTYTFHIIHSVPKGGGGGKHPCPIFQPFFCYIGAPRGPVGPIVIEFTRPLIGIISVAKNNQFHTIKVQMGIHVYYSKKLSYTPIFKPSYIIRIGLWEISVDLIKSWVYRTTINRHIKACENSKFYMIQF